LRLNNNKTKFQKIEEINL